MTNTVTAVQLGVNGRATIVNLPSTDGESGVATALRAVLECRTVDVVRLAPGLDMWIDDEGLLTDGPEINRVATRIARDYGLRWQPYVGTVVFAAGDANGEPRSLSENRITALLATADLGGVIVVDASHHAGGK
ncbi:DUF3846 domain-containing protein [Rhodococcus erythropolis]|uniref:DUF3846 domain-containing protein n=1 Tax=Rhodococcus erythropolis TaxID=1833 RepID=UPI002949DFCD|nr:DUF3846 domain-containing protein [Rhodococcus erythropolis]MDV6278764.1 DUF3846 domain-containing protein [Rhodococcus erythropolis]